MHELLAPIFWVVDADAVDCTTAVTTSVSLDANTDEDKNNVSGPHDILSVEDEESLKNTLNSNYIEHDAFTLFKRLMQSASAWYKLGDQGVKTIAGVPPIHSPIVEMSRHIHENLLAKADPELARHLRDMDVLPQVFLM